MEPDDDLYAAELDNGHAPAFVRTSPHAARLTAAASALLWLLVGTGAIGGLAAWFTRPAGAASAPPAVIRSPTGPIGWAQAFVATYLRVGEGQEGQLHSFYPGVPTLDKVTPAASTRATVSPYALHAAETSPGYWAVTVAVIEPATVTAGAGGFENTDGSDGDGSASSTGLGGAGGKGAPAGDVMACYQVSLLARGDAEAGGVGPPGSLAGYAATRLPDRVSCPPTLAGAPNLALGGADLSQGDPVDDVVRRFLTALLTGDGEVSRYSSPGAGIRPIIPVPYTGVELVSLARDTTAPASGDSAEAAPPRDGQRLRVLATIRVSGPDGIRMLSYPLRLTARAGRWEISALDSTPPLRGSEPPVAPAPTPQDTSAPLTSPSTASSPGGPAASGWPTGSGPDATPPASTAMDFPEATHEVATTPATPAPTSS
ncbi:hypothetical protein E0F15_20590 [Frankia sp. B2]|uniref:conjugal transfer protein n=1 Tax=Frankia sp. B2 TaxID=2541730 RepID=UPI00106D8026|nr:conjugal transfer protein [Frankia sp. B2]TFE25057.1 hypothetical protein E0F15_20590 [Frankia sp. B2]